jgi:acyl transferase domain-containing protein
LYPTEPAALGTWASSSGAAEPARSIAGIEAAYAAGVRVFLELAPGTQWTTLVQNTLAGRPHRAIALEGVDGVTSLWRALAQLSVSGCPLRLDALWSEFTLDADPRSAPRPLMPVKVGARNLGRKYPPLDGRPASLPVAPAPSVPVQPAIAAPRPPETAHVPAVPAEPAWAEPAWQPAVTTPDWSAPTEATVDWLRSLDDMNRLTNEVHLGYQRMMGQSHLAFLQYSQTSITDLLAQAEPAGAPPEAPVPALPMDAGSPTRQ